MHKQQGMSLIGMLLTMAVVVILAIITMRVVPVYLQNFEVKRSIEALKTIDPTDLEGDAATNAEYVKKKLMNQFEVNGLDTLKMDEFKVTPSEQSGAYRIEFKYTVIRPLVSNVSLMFNFEESKEVVLGSK